MIAKRNRSASSHRSRFVRSNPLAAVAAPGNCASNEVRLLWTWVLGDMLRATSELLMLATSRSPAQWMTQELAHPSPSLTDR